MTRYYLKRWYLATGLAAAVASGTSVSGFGQQRAREPVPAAGANRAAKENADRYDAQAGCPWCSCSGLAASVGVHTGSRSNRTVSGGCRNGPPAERRRKAPAEDREEVVQAAQAKS